MLCFSTVRVKQKMALCDKAHVTADDDDEDLEALRLAALQTLRANKPSVPVTTSKVSQQRVSAGRGVYRGGMSRARPGRNSVFQRHRVNSNLIAIVPVSEDTTVANNATESKPPRRGLGTVSSDGSKKLILPQDRYCKMGNSLVESEEHAVTSKFSRYEDSNSDSSAEDSDEGEGSSERTSAGENEVAATVEPDNDPDVLVMEAEDDEDSLEKLMDELEEEMNRTETDTPVGISVKKDTHKTLVHKVNNSHSENVEKVKKDISKSSKSKHVSAGSEKSKSKVPLKTKTSIIENKILAVSSVPQKNVSTSLERNDLTKENNKLYRDPSSVYGSPSRYASKDNSPKRCLSPISGRHTRSSSRSPLPKRSRSRSPRTRYYSPPSRLPPSPRGRFSRSPVRSPRRSRSRSPVRLFRSPMEKQSRSPPWYSPSSHHLSRISPRRSDSPRPRRDFSPRRSISPRSNHISPVRSPGQSRWPLSPRRSPLHSRRSPSPSFSRRPHSRTRRISPSSPRRPVSSLRRRLSPSPIRRNPSPPHKYSPLRRNPSPPHSRYSRSLSRSPVPRSRSPISRSLHAGSPPPLSPRWRLSCSPRRQTSHSPYNRIPPKRVSPVSRKSSPWSPPRQAAGRYSPSLPPKQRSSSPYRMRRRSNSSGRETHRNRQPKRISHSPVRDSRRPLQESRLTNINQRSRSPPAVPHVIPGSRSRHGSRSPGQSRLPQQRSISRLSSISLSPSPERTAVNDSHRYKSPLRVHSTDYRAIPITAPKESKNIPHHVSREGKGMKSRNRLSPLPTANVKVSTKTRPNKRKESRNKLQKKLNKEDTKTEPFNWPQERTHGTVEEKFNPEATGAKQNTEVDAEVLSVLEARRRKFETAGPVKPTAKKICLKAVRSEQREEKAQQSVKEKEDISIKTSDSESRLLEDSEDDFYDLDDHEPFPELDFLSSDESDIDNESRFKLSEQKNVTGESMTTSPFSKTLDRPSTCEEKPIQHRKTADIVKVKDTIEKEVTDKLYTKKIKEMQRESDEDSWEKDKTSSKMKGSRQTENQSKAVGDDFEQNNQEEMQDDKEEAMKASKDGDLRTELSRRRAERLTKAGSLHEKLPARLLQSAFEGVVGKKGSKYAEREEKHVSSKQSESKKEKSDVRRVLVLKRPAVERRVASINVTIPKEPKGRGASPPAKLPIHMRLGLPSIGAGSTSEERITSSRRRNRKPKLKRNVMLGNNKV